METAVLVANPAASQFTGGLHRAVARGLARRYRLEAVWPNSPEEARITAAKAAAEGVELVVAMGGDGVCHHVAGGLVGSATHLGILPAGTTNVLARLLGIPHRPGAALRLLVEEHRVSREAVLELVGSGDEVGYEGYACFALGVGADAWVVAEAEAEPYRKYRFGSVHYARTTLRVAWTDLRRRSASAEVHVDGETLPAFGMMVQFRAAYTYFGRLPLRLGGDPPDPMTVLALTELRMRRVLPLLQGVLGRRGLTGLRGFHVREGVDRVVISSPEPLPVQADGELLPSVTRLEARHLPAALGVVVP